MIEVFIGGWNNKKSAIRLNGTKPDKVEELTSDIVRIDFKLKRCKLMGN